MGRGVTEYTRRLTDMLYSLLVDIADISTGEILAHAEDLIPLIMARGFNAAKPTVEQTRKCLRILEKNGKLAYVASKGNLGTVYSVLELAKGKTVTTTIPVQRAFENTFAPKSVPAPPVEEPVIAEPEAVEPLYDMKDCVDVPEVATEDDSVDAQRQKAWAYALDDAELALEDSDRLIARVFTEYMHMRDAMSKLLTEVRRC